MIVWSSFSFARCVTIFGLTGFSDFVFTLFLVILNDYFSWRVLCWNKHAVLFISMSFWWVQTIVAVILVAKTSALRALLWTSVRLLAVVVSLMVNMKFINKNFTLYCFCNWGYLIKCEFSKLIFPNFFFNLKGLVTNTLFSTRFFAVVSSWTQMILYLNFITIFVIMNHSIFIIIFYCLPMQMIFRNTTIITKSTLMNTFCRSTMMFFMLIHKIVLASPLTYFIFTLFRTRVLVSAVMIQGIYMAKVLATYKFAWFNLTFSCTFVVSNAAPMITLMAKLFYT